MVAPVVLRDAMAVVVVVAALGLCERDGRHTPTNNGGDGKRRRDLPCLDYEHLLLLSIVAQVMKLLTARSSSGAWADHCDGGAAATITVVAERPETMQAISRNRLPVVLE